MIYKLAVQILEIGPLDDDFFWVKGFKKHGVGFHVFHITAVRPDVNANDLFFKVVQLTWIGRKKMCCYTLPDWRDPVKKNEDAGTWMIFQSVSGWCWIFPNAKKIWRLPIHINPCGVALNIPQSSIAWGMFHENHPAIGIGDPPLMEPPIDCAALTGGGAGIFLREAVAGWSWRMSMVKKNREKNQLNIPSGNLT